MPSYRRAKDVGLLVPRVGEVTGDVAWGGNWFFLAKSLGERLAADNVVRLTEIGHERLAELVTDAWRMRAPEALAAEFDVAG